MSWEFAAAESYCYSRMAEVAEQMDERVRTVSERQVFVVKDRQKKFIWF